MENHSKDRHLDVPSEANRDTHINFTALENNETDPADEPATGALSGKMDGRSGKGRNFTIMIDNVPYLVKAVPFTFNDETRFYITINDGPEHVFTWDREVGHLRAIDDDAAVLPDTLEQEISERLQSKLED